MSIPQYTESNEPSRGYTWIKKTVLTIIVSVSENFVSNMWPTQQEDLSSNYGERKGRDNGTDLNIRK